VSDLFAKLTSKQESFDRITRVVLNELLMNLGEIISESCVNHDGKCSPGNEARLGRIDLAVTMVIECMAQCKMGINKEFMLMLGAKVDLTGPTNMANPFDSALIRETDVDNTEKYKDLKKHVGKGIFGNSKRPGPKPPPGQPKAPYTTTPKKAHTDRLGERPGATPKKTQPAATPGANGAAGRGQGKNGRGRGRGAKSGGGPGRGAGQERQQPAADDDDDADGSGN
jgi:hypothetical protein